MNYQKMAGLPIYLVEAFTIGNNQPFSGNVAGVCVLNFDDDTSDEQKQKIAAQLNAPVTAFISQGWTDSKPLNSYSSSHWALRWFTPKVEIWFCGHATMGAANIICNEIIRKSSLLKDATDVDETTITFESKKRQLEATINWSTGLIALNFPSTPTVPIAFIPEISRQMWVHQIITQVLGPEISADTVDDVRLATATGLDGYFLLRLKNTGHPEQNMQLLTKVTPNFQNLVRIKTGGTTKMTSVTITVQGWPEIGKPQFYSRYFTPWIGIDEDQVTGSSHTMLTGYWFEEFREQGIKLESDSILGKQLSSRSGEMRCSMRGLDRVNLVGQSRLALKGEFYPK